MAFFSLTSLAIHSDHKNGVLFARFARNSRWVQRVRTHWPPQLYEFAPTVTRAKHIYESLEPTRYMAVHMLMFVTFMVICPFDVGSAAVCSFWLQKEG
jgi:hypothetical protein